MPVKKIILFLLFGVVLFFTHGPLRAPLVKELATQFAEVPAFSPKLDLQQPPLQTNLPRPWSRVAAGDFHFTKLARFEVDARVLSRRDYRLGRDARFCPVDLALGWGDMARDEVLEHFKIRQSNRFYFWRTQHFPIPRNEVVAQSANMHMIPANREAFAVLRRVKEGDRIRAAGYLVNVTHEDGQIWATSTTRTDTGAGSCEIVLVLRMEIVSPDS